MPVEWKAVRDDLAKGGLAFAGGLTVQELQNLWWAYANGVHANLGETWNDFANYWGLAGLWNLAGLVAGLGLSLVPKKEGSKGRTAARILGYAILGAEGWGYANHLQSTPGIRIFEKASNPGAGPGSGTGPPQFIFGRPEQQGRATAGVSNLF